VPLGCHIIYKSSVYQELCDILTYNLSRRLEVYSRFPLATCKQYSKLSYANFRFVNRGGPDSSFSLLYTLWYTLLYTLSMMLRIRLICNKTFYLFQFHFVLIWHWAKFNFDQVKIKKLCSVIISFPLEGAIIAQTYRSGPPGNALTRPV